jgi:hypothetical protein
MQHCASSWANIIYVFGDSHSVIFLGAESKYKTCVCGYDGASITGLDKKDSRLEYGKHVLDTIRYKPKTHLILMKMGQVDMEFIMYHKLYVKQEQFTFEEFCQQLINKYRDFIKKVLEINQNVIIGSINLPSYKTTMNIRDYITIIVTDNDTSIKEQMIQNIQLAETNNFDPQLSNFSLEQMTQNFQYFNDLLSNLAKEMHLDFFDTTSLFVNEFTGVLKTEYTNYNHHYLGYNDDTTDAKNITHAALYSLLDLSTLINH